MLKIKLLRMSLNLSQWELSHKAGLSQGRYSMVERGLIEPTTVERLRLASALGVKPDTLFRPAVRLNSTIEVSNNSVACS
jgi:transcriptional regulator with XRE-family HTH domain